MIQSPFFVSMDIQAFIDHLRFERRYSEHTLRAYLGDLESYEAFLDELGVKMLDASSKDIRRWVVTLMEGGSSPRSVQRRLSALKSYYRTLKARSIRFDNPATSIRGPKTPSQLPSAPSMDELQRLLFTAEYYPEGIIGLRDRCLLQLFYFTGMRTAELQTLKYSDVDLRQGQVKVYGKRGKERIIPLAGPMLDLLSDFMERRHELDPIVEYLFVTDEGKKLYPAFVYRRVNHYIGLVSSQRKRSPHVLRHAFATHMLEQGAELQSIKDLLGHASLASTQVYTHTDMERLRKIHGRTHPRA